MSLYNKIFYVNTQRILSCLKQDIDNSFLSLVYLNAIRMTFREKYFIFGNIIQALQLNCEHSDHNTLLFNKLIKIIHLSLTSMHHTMNLPCCYNNEKDSLTGLNNIHVKYNESITQLVLLLITFNVSKDFLNFYTY